MQHKPVIKPLGAPFIELQSIDSTNNYALARVRERLAEHGTVFFAHEQTAGKGQMGRQWLSQKDVNIAMSIVLDPGPLKVSQQFWLSACMAVAVSDLFNRYVGGDLAVKWPNDIYWHDRKLAGILIENIVSSSQVSVGSWDWAVAGIGVNVNQTSFPPHLPNPVSLKQITGKEFNTVQLSRDLCEVINQHYSQLLQNGFGEIHKKYNKLLYLLNKSAKLKKNNAVFHTTIKGVSETGELITHNGRFEECFLGGEVIWIV